MAASQLGMELLQALAETPPDTYLQKQPSGLSTLRELFDLAAEAGLAPASAQDDVARLHWLFDVALEHGLGGVVRDYVAEVCSHPPLTASDGAEGALADAGCVRRWLQRCLAASRQRLAAWLASGLGATTDAGTLSRELARLQMLQLVAEALQQHTDGSSTQQPTAAAAAAARAAADVAECRRLVQCVQLLAWLGQQQLLPVDRPTGRYPSEQVWRTVAAQRQDGAAAGGSGSLFSADLAADLEQHGLASLAYPPASPDRLLSALFLGGSSSSSGIAGGAAGASSSRKKAAPGSSSGGGSSGSGSGEAALQAKLALVAYYLADAAFMQPEAIVRGLRLHFHVPPSTSYAWLLQQLLDDSHSGGMAGAEVLQRAAALVPMVDGSRLPHKVLQVFARKERPDVALALLRQRIESSGVLDEASVALAVRFQNGLVGEAFLGMKQHLAAAAAAAAAAASTPAAGAEQQRQHAQLLVGQLLQSAAMLRVVHGVAQMPFDAVEEQAATGWLEAQAAGGRLEAALMLVLYYLLRGRTPEALHAYSLHCPPTPTTEQQLQLAALLTEAARMLPAPQRALIVQQGACPALLLAAGGSGEEAVGVALTDGIADVAADVAPAMLSVGPTPGEAPLVGSIPVLLEQQRLAAAATAAVAGIGRAATFGGQQRQQQQQQSGSAAAAAQLPMLFGRATAAGSSGGAARGGEAAAAGPATFLPSSMPAGRASGHEFDHMLGLGPAPEAAAATAAGGGAGGKGKRRWGGSAYR